MTYANGNLKDTVASATYKVTQAAQQYHAFLWNIGTTEESQASFGDIATLGWTYILNTDNTNFVKIGKATTSYFMRLKAKEGAWVRLEPGITLYAIADTAACKVLFKFYND